MDNVFNFKALNPRFSINSEFKRKARFMDCMCSDVQQNRGGGALEEATDSPCQARDCISPNFTIKSIFDSWSHAFNLKIMQWEMFMVGLQKLQNFFFRIRSDAQFVIPHSFEQYFIRT